MVENGRLIPHASYVLVSVVRPRAGTAAGDAGACQPAAAGTGDRPRPTAGHGRRHRCESGEGALISFITDGAHHAGALPV